MGMGRLGQAFTAKEIFDLVKADLSVVEEEIALESLSSVDAITTIGRYLHSSGGKRLRHTLLLLCSKLIGGGVSRAASRTGSALGNVRTPPKLRWNPRSRASRASAGPPVKQ